MKFNLPYKPKVFLPPLVLFVILLLVMPRMAKLGYDYRKGSEWKYETLMAPFDFPILKTQEQIQQEKSASAGVIPYYRFDEQVVSRNLKAVEGLSFGPGTSMKNAVLKTLNDIYSKGIVSDQGVKVEKNSEALSDNVLYIQKDKRAVKHPVTEVYKVTDARNKLLSTIAKEFEKANVDSILRAVGVYDYVAPNLVFDKQTTSLVHSESSAEVSPTLGYVTSGQLIVTNGEIVTAEIEQMLDSYKAEYEANMGYSGPTFVFWLGNAILALSLVTLLFLVIYFTNSKIFHDYNRYVYLNVVFLISSIAAIIVARAGGNYAYIVPFTLTALYLQSFFQNKVILPICIISLLPLLIFANDGIVLFVMYTIAGIVSLLVFKYFSKGWRQFVGAAIIFGVLAFVYTGFRMVDMVSGAIFPILVRLFVGSMLSVALFPIIYLFEKIFNLVSNSRLQELCDTSNPIIMELQVKAPGTFHHCMNVMNMAGSLARSIDANELLVKAGALYHDIGKMNNPACFVENESLMDRPEDMKYHYGRAFEDSSQDIIRHVTDGLETAKAIGLPDVLCDFIASHHGTTRTGYFYMQYVRNGGDPQDDAKFRYPGKKPVTKEQVLLMVCDSIEAASRTLRDRTPEGYSAFVESIVNSKMSESQFDQSEVTLKELEIIKSGLKTYLLQENHQRVEYPKK